MPNSMISQKSTPPDISTGARHVRSLIHCNLPMKQKRRRPSEPPGFAKDDNPAKKRATARIEKVNNTHLSPMSSHNNQFDQESFSPLESSVLRIPQIPNVDTQPHNDTYAAPSFNVTQGPIEDSWYKRGIIAELNTTSSMSAHLIYGAYGGGTTTSRAGPKPNYQQDGLGRAFSDSVLAAYAKELIQPTLACTVALSRFLSTNATAAQCAQLMASPLMASPLMASPLFLLDVPFNQQSLDSLSQLVLFENAVPRLLQSDYSWENSFQYIPFSVPACSSAWNLISESKGSHHREICAPHQEKAESCLSLSSSDDRGMLNDHQRFLRKQIEFFRATIDDIMSYTRGRNNAVALRQVGIRCRHCSHISVGKRSKGSTYFPSTLMGIYQAAQNICQEHLQSGSCPEMPDKVKRKLLKTRAAKSAVSGTGKAYWAETARNLGLTDTDDGIRFATDASTPLHAASLLFPGTIQSSVSSGTSYSLPS